MSARFVMWNHDEARAHGLDGSLHPEWRTGLYDTATEPPTQVALDGGEPEDQSLLRDWAWVAPLLNKLSEERPNTVAWLREQAATAHKGSCGCYQRGEAFLSAANAIERGEHADVGVVSDDDADDDEDAPDPRGDWDPQGWQS